MTSPAEPGRRLILLRLSSELATKARGTRRRFMRRLAQNIRDALSTTGAPFDVSSEWTRILAWSAAADAPEVLRRVPGISSLSVVEAQCAADLEEIVRVGRDLFAERVRGRSYAVRAKRSGNHPFNSGDVQQHLGAALNPGARVDLDHPEVEVEVEVRDQRAYFFSGRYPGVGGLPLGVEGRAVCLLSGGFDSAVAAWMMLKRGVELDYVFCNLAGEAYERSVVEVARVLAERWSYGTRPKLHVLDFGPPVDALRAHAAPKYWQVLLKRLMYRAAEGIAVQLHASAIITGEAIGQVSSQTLANLAAIDGATHLPVFRPLIGFDKMDIVELTRRLGTFEISSKVKEYCAIAPGNPVTNATARETEREEQKVDLSPVRTAVEGKRALDLRSLTAVDLVQRYLLIDHVPEAAVVLDLRGEEEWSEWHYPGALRRDAWALPGELSELDRDRPYVLYCDQGMQAAHLAETMQRAGFEAYAFRGGTRALREREPAASERPTRG